MLREGSSGRQKASIDRGYAWVILFASTVTQMISMAVTFGSVGTLFIELTNKFPDESKTKISVLGTLQLFTSGVVGYFLGPWVEKIGHRRLAICGALISGSGLLLSSFTTSLNMLYFTYGPPSGTGNAFIMMAGYGMVSEYFEKRRSLAMGVIMSGYSVGAIIGPPLVVLLGELAGLQGVFLAYSGMILQCVWLGALFRPLQSGPPRRKEGRETMIESIDLTNGMLSVETSGGEKVVVDAKQRTRASLRLSAANKPPSGEDKSYHEVADTDNPPEEEMLYACADSHSAKPRRSCGGVCLKAMALKPCSDPLYLMFVAGTFFLHCGHLLPYTYLPLRAKSMGAPEWQASLYLTLLAGTSLGFRVIVGAVGDCMPIKRKFFASITMIINGLLSVASAFVTDRYVMLVYPVAFGFIAAWYLVLKMTTVMDLFGPKIFTSYLGHANLAVGFAVLVMNSTSALLIDVTGDIAYPFMVFGLAQMVSGVLVLIVCGVFTYRQNKTSKPSE